MMEEMNALHEFMGKFGREIEVIWGSAVEEELNEDVKVTLLATGFSIEDVAGIDEHQTIKTKTEEIEQKVIEEQKKKEKEEELRLLNKYYGSLAIDMISSESGEAQPYILSFEELDDDSVLEALDKTAVFKRDKDFDPRNVQYDNRAKSSLFDQ